MNSNLKLLWTDMHSNMHSEHIEYLEEWYNHAQEVIDFWQIAYYPYYMRSDKTGIRVEDIYPEQHWQEQWEILREFTNRKNQKTGAIPLFMGFEWQGSGKDGDHNVFYLENDQSIHMPMRYQDLLSKLPKNKAIAIPHHLAYQVGYRGKNWATHNENFSPFAEIFSSHGSSESGYTDVHMGRHVHMGPRAGGSSVYNGLKLGHKVGIICSGDNHVVPAMYGHGLMGCYAEECTKESIWDALLKRHVYGVTGNKMKLKYSLDDYIMGDIITTAIKSPQHCVEVEGGDAIQRIELYKNNILLDTYTHSGKWEQTIPKDTVTFKFKLECGWGPDTRLYPDITSKLWSGKLNTVGEIISVEKCWTNFGQKITVIDQKNAEFSLTTHKSSHSGHWMGPSPVTTEGFIFEITAPYDSNLTLDVDGKQFIVKVADLLEDTQLFGFVDESRELAQKTFGFGDYYRSDPFWHNAYKVRLLRAVPKSAYLVDVKFNSEPECEKGSYYFVKVYQTDGNLAWSSPIWVE